MLGNVPFAFPFSVFEFDLLDDFVFALFVRRCAESRRHDKSVRCVLLFSALRLGVFACGHGIDGILS